jgi:osmotically-inducible protein OsmY
MEGGMERLPDTLIATSDRELQVRVLRALEFDPLDRTAIGVTVSHGVVTLQGRARNRREVWLAERVTHSVPGVRGVANELVVESADDPHETSATIAEAALNALTWYRVVMPGTVKVIVADGYVTLTGVVTDPQQRGAAERAIRGLRGVRGVWNALRIGSGGSYEALQTAPGTH